MRRLSSSWTSWSRQRSALHRPGCGGPGAGPFPVVLGRDLARPPLPRCLFPSGKHRHVRASVKSHACRLWISRAPVHERASMVIDESVLSRSRPYPYAGSGAPKDRLRRRRRCRGEELVVGLAAVDRSGCRPRPAIRTGCLGNRGNGRERQGNDGEQPMVSVRATGLSRWRSVGSDPGGGTGSPAYPVPKC